MTSASSIRKTVAVATAATFIRDRFKAALDAAGHRAMMMKSVAQLLATVRADFDDLEDEDEEREEEEESGEDEEDEDDDDEDDVVDDDE